ncbi:MAG: NAD(P)/FAD-dependent oxidoreductase, partial [Anaerolineales bacterium]|nr:NAD(P)/FAD-dependent oxidoreductase [Anaerolineales bacterium]
ETAVSRGELYPLTGMRLVSPSGHTMQAEFHKGESGTDSYVAPRLYFDALIQQHAVESGAEFQQAQVTGPVVEDGRVIGVRAKANGNSKTWQAKVVVGADGVTSSITRALRPKTAQHIDKHRAVALRAYIDDIEIYPGEVEFYLYNEILPGYAWVFPTGEHSANIGLGMRLDHFRGRKQSLEEMLRQFLAMPVIKKRLKEGGKLRNMATWQLNFGSQKQLQHVYEGAILVGDAAGFINPLTGGGIHNSLVSAQLAAKTIHNALAQRDTSRKSMLGYEQECHDALWDNMKRSFNIQRTLLRFPSLVDWLVKWSGENSSLAKTFLTKL